MNMGTRSRSFSWLLTIWVFVALVLLSSPATKAQSRSKGGSTREVYSGTILFIGGPRTVGTTTRTFTLTIDCYTPADEVQRLAGVLKDGGQDRLLDAIGKRRCGRIQIGSGVGRDVNVIFASRTDEGERKITIVFERWIQFFEARYGTRSRDYPFSYIELFVDDDKGKAEGTMIPLAKIRFRGENTIEVENFGAYPARFMGVRRRK